MAEHSNDGDVDLERQLDELFEDDGQDDGNTAPGEASTAATLPGEWVENTSTKAVSTAASQPSLNPAPQITAPSQTEQNRLP